jgi:hypothetical protein
VKEHAIQLLGLSKARNATIQGPKTLSKARRKQWVFPDPSTSELQIDWDGKGITSWTKRIATIFEARFLSERRKGSFPSLEGDIQAGEIARMFLVFVTNLKKVYSRAQEIETTKGGKYARSYGRRKQVSIISLHGAVLTLECDL